MSNEPAPGAKSFDLFTRDGPARFRWRLTDQGIVVEDKALAIHRAGGWTRAPYADIASITLNSGTVGRSGTIANCTIQLRNGSRIIIANVSANGLPDGSHDGPYRNFIEAFHDKLVETGAAKSIRFVSGYSPARMNGLIAITIVAGVFFIALPLILLLVTRDLKLLIALVFGGTLLWSVGRIIANNQPGNYSPAQPPDFVD